MFDWYQFWKEAIDLEDSKFVFDRRPKSENSRFARFGRHAEPSAPKGRRFGRLWKDSRFHLQNSENEATLLRILVTLLFVAKRQTRLRILQLDTSSSLG